MAIQIIENVPAAAVDDMEQIARDSGATDVRRRPEPDGEFTLIITYPDFQTHADFMGRSGRA
ncbi:MAG TPA: hypothetical protein VGC56_11400 [Allosphingosinicella sp.]|jgi:hypothetical protein